MYFEDLSPCHYHSGPCGADNWMSPLLAVGWLEHPNPFPTGEPLEDLTTRLEGMVGLTSEHYSHHHFRGLHACDLCPPDESSPWSGAAQSHLNLWIPGEGIIYIAPGLITHYIRDHFYQPPAGFIAAVMACPEYGSPSYCSALQAANGGQAPPLQTREKNEQYWKKQREEMARQSGKS